MLDFVHFMLSLLAVFTKSRQRIDNHIFYIFDHGFFGIFMINGVLFDRANNNSVDALYG